MRIMGLDLGDKKIGVALSDPLGLTAQGLEVIVRRGSTDNVLKRMKEIAGEYGVEKVVVGLPRNMDGSAGPRAEKARAFGRMLAKELELPVDMWDERLTTAAAERLLIGADLSRARRKQVIDKMAAALILQSYLESRAPGG